MRDSNVYLPRIDDSSARAIADFCCSINHKERNDTRARVVGYLHGGYGAKIRLEPIEVLRGRDISEWRRIATSSDLDVRDVMINSSEGYADITAEYKPSISKTCNPSQIVKQWKNLLWPLILFLVFLKLTGVLDVVSTMMHLMSLKR